MRCHPQPALLVRGMFRSFVSAVAAVASLLAAPNEAQAAPGDPRPYLLQVGGEDRVVGLAVAPNGYSFTLLPSGQISITGPDQLIRPSIAIPGLTGVPSAIATNGDVSLADATQVPLFVATLQSGLTPAKVWTAVYDVEAGRILEPTVASVELPNKAPQYLGVQPTADGAVYVAGADTTSFPAMNFIVKLDSNLNVAVQPKVWGQNPLFSSNGLSFVSQARNRLDAMTIDADGNAYVAGQWDSVYCVGLFPYFILFDRFVRWNVADTGLNGIANSIQSSVVGAGFFGFGGINGQYSEAENRTAYIVKFSPGLVPLRYTNTTDRVPNYFSWAIGTTVSNESTFVGLKVNNGFLFAAGNWSGYSMYGNEQTFGNASNMHVVRFDLDLGHGNRAGAVASDRNNIVHSLDVSPSGNVFVSGYVGDSATTFRATISADQKQVAGRGFFFSMLPEDLGKWTVSKSNSPAPVVFGRLVTQFNSKSGHAETVGTFRDGQLSIGNPATPSLLPTSPASGSVNFLVLLGIDGLLINQIGLTVRSNFVDAEQVMVAVGDNRPAPLPNFDPATREGTLSLLSDAIGTVITVTVPPRVYVDGTGIQLYPEYDARNNEIAPANAVTRHISTGFSVTGEATTGATNTYTFVLSRPTRVIFNWRTEHALGIASAVSQDLGIADANALAMGKPEPAVNTYWIEENQPVAAFIDGVALDFTDVGRRFRVSGFDATGSSLIRPPPLPSMPASRVLLTANATLQDGSSAVVLTQAANFQVGWLVMGPGVPAGATIVSKTSQTQFTLSVNATQSGVQKLTFNDSLVQRSVGATLVKGNASVTLQNPTGVQQGWLVSGPGIPLGTAVASVIDSTHVTLTKAPEPVTLSAKTTSAPPVQTVGVATSTVSGSQLATVIGSANLVAGMSVNNNGVNPGPPIVQTDTTITNVQPQTISVNSALTNNSTQVIADYHPQLLAGLPVSGPGIPNGTLVQSLTEVPLNVNASLVQSTNIARVPPTPAFQTGIPIRGPGIAPVTVNNPEETIILQITPVVSTVRTSISANSTTATVGYVDGGGLLNALVSGAGIAANTSVDAVEDEPVTRNATVASGNTTVTGVDTDDLAVGDPVGPTPTIPAGTTISQILNGTSLVLSAAPTANGTNLEFTRRKLTFSNAATGSGAPNLNYTTGRDLELSRPAIATTQSTHQVIPSFSLQFTNRATATGTQSLSYTTSKVLTFSKAALETGTSTLFYFTPVVSTATVVKVPSTAALSAGMQVSGPGIDADTTILSVVDATTLQLSKPAMLDGTNALEFFRPNVPLIFFSNFGSYAFDAVQDRQQVPQWIMSGPATINYRWTTQYLVRTSTSVNAARDLPEVRLNSASSIVAPGELGYGAGEHWYNAGSNVFVGARFGGGTGSRQLVGWLNATSPPFRSDRGDIDFDNDPVFGTRRAPDSFYYVQIPNLQRGINVLWNYGGTIHYETVTIGNAATFDTTPALAASDKARALDIPPDRKTLVSGPAGSGADQMVLWDAKSKRLYPVRPGKVLLEYGSQDDPVIVQLTSDFANLPNYSHITHPELPGVILDPSPADAIAFQQLAYSSGNATAEGGSFLSTQNGKAVVIYTRRDPSDTQPANGDLTKESVVVKVVETKKWDEVLGAGASPAVIGTKLTHVLPAPSNDVLETGFVVHKNARYNAEIYDRTRIVGSGPIIPVNRHFTGLAEDDLIVIWFTLPDLETGVVWGHSVERFVADWPANPGRIVLASRLGSEGKDSAGNDQIAFTADKFDSVKIYNQPDRELPGYNPNEEHALLAPSFKRLDQANPPPAAYALQTGRLNKRHDPALTNDDQYTSDPYVLLQYRDKEAGETKMAVYAIQAEDSAVALNPDVDPVSGRKFPYTFNYDMRVGEPVQPPYPLLGVIGLVAPPETFGINESPARVYWEDYNGVAYAAGQGAFSGYFYYPMKDEFWNGEGDTAVPPGTSIPFVNAETSDRGGIQLKGTTTQGMNVDGFTGTVNNPKFRALYAPEEGHAVPIFSATTPLSSLNLGDLALSFHIRVGSGNAVKVSFGTLIPILNGGGIQVIGTAADFVQAVNLSAGLAGKVSASLTANGIVLEALTGEDLTLTDGNGSPLATAGFATGTLPRQPAQFVANVGGTGEVQVSIYGTTVEDLGNALREAFPAGELSVLKTPSGAVRLFVPAGVSLELTDGTASPLQSAGIGSGGTDPFSPVSSGQFQAGEFAVGDNFTMEVDGQTTTVTLAGTNPQDFVNAVNGAGQPKVTAALDAAGQILLSSTGGSLTLTDGTGSPLARAGLPWARSTFPATPVRYTAYWPENPAILKAGETLTFAGGEFRADHPTAPGLPGVIGWATGEVIFDSVNPFIKTGGGDSPNAFLNYTARLISPLEPRSVTLGTEEQVQAIIDVIQPSTGMTSVRGTSWKFNNLPASLSRRLSYEPLTRKLTLIGYVNDKTLGDSTLTAAPGPVSVLEPNILTMAEKQEMLDIPQLSSNAVWVSAVNSLYALSRNPNELSSGSDVGQAPYYVGLSQAYERDAATGEVRVDADGNPILKANSATPSKLLGPGLALVPSPAFLDPANQQVEGYVTLVENNDETIGGPVTLRVVKVSRNHRFRGAIKTIATDNVFSEQLTLRHSGDFGGNGDDIVYQWFYREEDGTEMPVPPGAAWNLFADTSNREPRGLGMHQIELKGNPILLLADQLFFVRYRHKDEAPAGGANSTNWAETQWEEYGAEFAGAANSLPGAYKPQLAQGWVKRVLDRINPYEARFNDFRNNPAPATYTSMIQQAGQRFEGPVALNPDKNVVENVGLIELYQTVLDRGRSLSIDLSSPVSTPGINNALLLAATRVTDLYLLLGNEAYSDAQDPTIGFGTSSTDFGSAASSIFTFQNQVPTLLDEELALLCGVPETYGRPAYNRLFWNFTKSEGEVAYAMNYNITDQNRDGFIDEKDAMIFYPQGHGDAWGHYLTAIKSQYGLLHNPYFNWVSRSEFYNLADVVIKVDFLDERKFADAAAARAKAGAEIVNLTYRSRYVEDPDGQWQGYTDTDPDRAWGVDEWARRAGQGAYFDWVTANALLPAEDTTRTGIQKVDRKTVTAIQAISAQLGKIQGTSDDANSGLNPLGLSPDVVPMDFNPVLTGPIAQNQTQFEQIAARAEAALANAVKVYDNANLQANRIRMQEATTASFTKQTFEQDRDYRNRLIEIFGTPYSGQIGAGKAYPTGYNGPDFALYMYVDVNDLNSETVPSSSGSGGFQDFWASLPQLVALDPQSIKIGSGTVEVEPQFSEVFSRYFMNDVLGGTPTSLDKKNDPGVFDPGQMADAYAAFTSVDSYWHALSVGSTINLPAQATSYTFQAPPEWGKRSAPGELQAVISELVQAQATLGLAVADYDAVTLGLQTATKALRAEHALDSAAIMIMDKARKEQRSLSQAIAAFETVNDAIDIAVASLDRVFDATENSLPENFGLAVSAGSPAKGAVKLGAAGIIAIVEATTLAPKIINRVLAVEKESLGEQAAYEIQKAQYALDIQKALGEIEVQLWNEAAQRVVVFKRLEEMRQVSDRYRSVLQKGLALLEERADFNRSAAGFAQQVRYQDMGFRVFRNDALQKYRASFDLAARYTYLAAKAYDYETNLNPNDPASAQPLLQEIARTRTLGTYNNGPTNAAGGLSSILATLKGNYGVLKGRLGLNNPQVETTGFSLKLEQARANSASWKQFLENCRTDDLWTVPEFRRYCRTPAPRSAGRLPGLVIPFSSETTFGRNFFGRPLAAGDMAFNPTNFANKIASAGISFAGYPVASLAATPQVYLIPAGVDVMTVPNSASLETRSWNVIDQAMPVPFPVNSDNLKDSTWIPVTDGLAGPLAEIRRFSSFRAGITASAPPQAADTRLAGRSVWNTKWLLIIPGGTMLNDGDRALDVFINNVSDIKLHLSTYGYSGN